VGFARRDRGDGVDLLFFMIFLGLVFGLHNVGNDAVGHRRKPIHSGSVRCGWFEHRSEGWYAWVYRVHHMSSWVNSLMILGYGEEDADSESWLIASSCVAARTSRL
jgi:hypothetical protein